MQMNAESIEAPPVENIAVPDIFATGLLSIEEVASGIYRFSFYVNQQNLISGKMERVVVGRLVMSAEAAREGSRTSLKALGRFFMRNCVECVRRSCH